MLRTRIAVPAAFVAAAVSVAMAAPVSAAPQAAAPAVTANAGSYAANNDYCMGQCNDVLPPGNNGSATLAQILAFKAFGAKPKHSDDQLGKYADLVDGYTGLSNDSLSSYFNDSSFGVPSDQVASSIRPGDRNDVTIVRDKATGTPHINGTTRAGTEYGAGYAAGQDRLWMMDVFRHIGRGQLSGFAGGAESNRELEQSFFLQGAYTDSDLTKQVNELKNSGPEGQRAWDDVTAYLGGLNRYITDSKKKLNFPGEYDVTGNANVLTGNGIQPFTPEDLIAIGSVISALFGAGGGNQVQSALVKLAAEKRYGVSKGDKIWKSFREENDPEAVNTLHDGQTFPYAQTPKNAKGVAMPDAGSVSSQPIVFDPTGSAVTPETKAQAKTPKMPATTAKTLQSQRNLAAQPGLSKARGTLDKGVLPGDLLSKKHGMSNALVVNGKYTDDGHPMAVFGPQTGYFAPQLLMLEELNGPGIKARGAAFAGLNFYVQLGRGVDYSWSATSANQNMTDMYAVTLCNADGSTPTKDSVSYLYHGVCTPMERIERSDSWSPTLADSTAAGSYKLVAYRTKYGIVQYRATLHGKPIAYTALRSTYLHEANTLIGFQQYNDPSYMTGPKAFQQAASHITYTFNWLYVDSKHTAYYNSGLNPTRAADVDPNLPVLAEPAYEWRNWNADTNTVANTAFSAHPNSIDQDYYVSWNNKIAKGYTAPAYGQGSVYRVNLLDKRVKALVHSGKPVTRAELTQAMESAALTDLRAEDVLPELLAVIDSQPVTNPTEKAAVDQLRSWLKSGGLRQETKAGSKTYADADAIKTMDAWWPLLVKAEFQPGLGSDLYQSLGNALPIDEAPSVVTAGAGAGTGHRGSAFEHGWWTYVDKDLRNVLGRPVQGALGEKYCGAGDLAQCRSLLLQTLAEASGKSMDAVYPGDATCKAGDQWCADSIVQSPLGGITHDPTNWQNRPTFQQVVQFPAGRGDNLANLASGANASATSYATPFLQAARKPQNAVDGDAGTKWQSKNADAGQALMLDLGKSQHVGRVVLQWDSSYATNYRVEVSDDGVNWRKVWSTSAGDGGTDNDEFSGTNAQYVRVVGAQSSGSSYAVDELQVFAQ